MAASKIVFEDVTLLKKPENYEEAKIIVRNSSESKFNKAYLNSIRFKAGLIAFVGAAVAVAVGLASRDVVVGIAIFINFGLISLASLSPLFARKRSMKQIENGSFFKHTQRKK